MARFLGVLRSATIYYGIPFRARRLAHFYSQFVSEGALCFDIGAHAGNRIRCWRRLGARVVAVEPQQDFFRILHRLYGRDPSVTLLQCAVGRSAGEATLFISERHPTVTTLSSEWIQRMKTDPAFNEVEWSKSAPTEVTTLQGLIESYGLPEFIKIDVEGYEAEVLGGLSTAVSSLSFEYLPIVRHIALECVDRLSQLGEYRYNWSTGESHQLRAREWLDTKAIGELITNLPERSASGDIYARLVSD